ncbi:hypothetical protein [Chitinophaga solisilvae]|uniref:hypothetical protein n=1 Tax=Chitinophaga solisilvae TaxID=1233460 RepID=UPI00136B488A|nr:hypothetical protein [Chitinophaga solisilvae]
MKNIRIEKIGDVNADYPYLEVFLKDSTKPFLEVAISGDKEVSFKFYASGKDIEIAVEDWEYILSTAKDYLPKALKNEDDFLNFTDEQAR